LNGREYPPEAVWQAQELYCVARLTYAQVEREMGIAASTLKRWGKQYGWREKRESLARAESEMKADIVLARAGMIKELLDSRDPMIGFAVAKLEDMALKHAQAERDGQIQAAKSTPKPRQITSQADAAQALQEAVEIKLGRMLADPAEVDLKTVKGIKDALSLVAEMQPKENNNATNKGLTADQVETIRNRILGDG
jgi:transposase-like protein